MNRRDFLTGLSTSVGFATLASCFPRFAFAQEKKGQYFVLIYLPAGWDVSLATAPWIDSTRPAESEYFLEYRQDELIKTSYGFVGPAMKPMEKYLENLRIINGVYINATDVGHPSPSMYAMTGNGQGANSTLSAEIDFNIDKKPFGTIAKGPIVNSGKSLNVMDADSLFTMQKADMSSLITTNSQKMTDVTRAKLSLLQNQDRIDQYFKNLEDIRKTSENSSNIDAIIAAFAADLSSTAFIESKSGNLDTHSAHPGNHMKNLTEAFTEIAEIIGKFEKFSFDGQNSLLSQTTFMIVSDFARTPALNASQGKDHNAQSNSIITIGPRIQPGITGCQHLVTRDQSLLGIPYLAATPIDKTSEQPIMRRENSLIIRPENVVKSVFASMNLNAEVLGPSYSSVTTLRSMLK